MVGVHPSAPSSGERSPLPPSAARPSGLFTWSRCFLRWGLPAGPPFPPSTFL